jgi:hypothetical protein
LECLVVLAELDRCVPDDTVIPGIVGTGVARTLADFTRFTKPVLREIRRPKQPERIVLAGSVFQYGRQQAVRSTGQPAVTGDARLTQQRISEENGRAGVLRLCLQLFFHFADALLQTIGRRRRRTRQTHCRRDVDRIRLNRMARVASSQSWENRGSHAYRDCDEDPFEGANGHSGSRLRCTHF